MTSKMMKDATLADSVTSIFEAASASDKTLKVKDGMQRKLSAKRLKAVPYRKDRWLDDMCNGNISLFDNYPVPLSKKALVNGRADPASKRAHIIDALSRWRPKKRFHVQAGPSRTRKYIAFPELFKRWSGGRAIVSATDIHVRETSVEKFFDIDMLTHINLLPTAAFDARAMEMLTLVVSSRGNMTDSHSDDLDGSNYCLCGSKLWLAWDTHEGHEVGLQDCDRDHVTNRARFNLEKFLSLESARWFVVAEGQMLFLPGNYAHKVVTLENYIGVGGFYVSLLNAVRTIARWESKGANWTCGTDSDTEPVAPLVIEAVKNVCTNESAKRKRELGGSFVAESVRRWRSRRARTGEYGDQLTNTLLAELV